MLRPERLKPDDLCIVVSPSWGGPALFPHVYEAGLAFLRGSLGLRVQEARHARSPAATVAERVSDLHEAFADPEAKMIIASIGGDDAIRLLPSLDLSALRAAPKIVMGYSDTTNLLLRMAADGLLSFHGPSVMAGLAQATLLGEAYVDHLKAMLFQSHAAYLFTPYHQYSEGYEDWATNTSTPKPFQPNPGPKTLQGAGAASGELFGGCLESLLWLQGTPWWPTKEQWRGKVLFFETSEEVPTPTFVERTLRSWGAAGIFSEITALLVGRPRGYSPDMKQELEEILCAVVSDEFERPTLPILTDLDFGHTDPQWILPIGATVEVNAEAKTLRLLSALFA